MKNFNKILVSIMATLLVTTETAYAINVISPDVIDTKVVEHNYVKNPSARVNAANVVTSAAAVARDTSAGNKIDGVASFTCDTSALNGYCEWTTKTINQPDDYGNCMAYAEVKGDASLYSLVAYVGGVETAISNPIGISSGFRPVFINTACGSTATVRIKQTVAGTTPAINVGRLTWGRATNVAQIPMAGQFVGAIEFGTDCAWSRSTSSSFGNYSDDATCTTNVIQGNGSVSVVGAKRPAIQVNNALPGVYQVVFSGNLYKNNANSLACVYRMFDGTNVLGQGAVYMGGAAMLTPGFTGEYKYTAPASSLVFDMQATGDGGAIACDIWAASPNIKNKLSVYYFPSGDQQAINASNNWGLVSMTANGAAPAISANAPIIFPTVTKDTYAGYSTGTGRYTVVAPGEYRLSFAVASTQGNGTTWNIYKNGTAQDAIGYSYNDRAQGTGKVTAIAGDILDIRPNSATSSAASSGQISIERVPSPQEIVALLSSSVFTRYSGQKPIIDAYVSNSGTPTFSGIFDGFSSTITDNGVGDSTLTFSPAFSAAPRCTCVALEANTAVNLTCQMFSVSTTSVRILTKSASTGTALDRDFSVQCIGPK